MKNKNKEKNFKDKLESYESFEGDRMAMWENIEQELDEKKNRKLIWFWLFPILIGLLGVSWYVFGKNQPMIVEDTTVVNIPKQDVSVDVDSNNTFTKEAENNTFTKDRKNTNEQKGITTKNKSSETKTIQQQQNTNDYSKLKLVNTTSLNSSISNRGEQDLMNSKKQMQVKKENNELTILKKELAVQFLPILKSTLLEEVNDVPLIDTVMRWKALLDKKSPWSIRLGGGINSMTKGFDNNSIFGDIHLETQTAQLGWNFIFELEKTFSKDLYLTSGVHFNRNWLKFNYDKTKNTELVFNDVIIRYDINLFSGDTTFITGDTILNKVMTRNIQHHNQYDKLKIPILFGKRWRDNRFSYGGAAGIGIDFWLKQSGKFLSLDEVPVTYNSSEEGTGLPPLGWSAEFRGDFSFEINKKVNLFAQPYLSVALKNWSSFGDGAIQKPMVFGTNFGLQINF